MIAAYCDHKLIAPFTVEGACNRTVFETWIETCLIKCLKPGQWLIIDNATIDKGERIEQLIKEAGCHCSICHLTLLISIRLNDVGREFKHRIRQCLNDFDCLRDAMEHILKLAS